MLKTTESVIIMTKAELEAAIDGWIAALTYADN